VPAHLRHAGEARVAGAVSVRAAASRREGLCDVAERICRLLVGGVWNWVVRAMLASPSTVARADPHMVQPQERPPNS
jgi:hypothetical protein